MNFARGLVTIAGTTLGSIRSTVATASTAVAAAGCVCVFMLVSLFHVVGSGGALLLRERPRKFRSSILLTLTASMGTLLVSGSFGVPTILSDNIFTGPLVAVIGLLFVGYVVVSLFHCPGKFEDLESLTRSSRAHAWLAKRLRYGIDAIWFPRILATSVLAGSLLASIILGEACAHSLAVVYFYLVSLTYGQLDAFEHACGHYRPLDRTCDSYREDCTLSLMRVYCEYLLPILLCRIPFWYEVEHNVVHHAEDNGVDDLQTRPPQPSGSSFFPSPPAIHSSRATT